MGRQKTPRDADTKYLHRFECVSVVINFFIETTCSRNPFDFGGNVSRCGRFVAKVNVRCLRDSVSVSHGPLATLFACTFFHQETTVRVENAGLFLFFSVFEFVHFSEMLFRFVSMRKVWKIACR